MLTSNDDGRSTLQLVTHTTVDPAVLRLALPDRELPAGATLLHLVPVPAAQHAVSLPPLDRHPGSRELTVEAHRVPLLHLNVLQLLDEGYRTFWR